jgi:hypothetical protein
MTHTLDDLLDATGLSELRSSGMHKIAGAGDEEEEHEDFLKLADRCERAAAQVSAAPVNARERELQEKTAAIAVIARTLTEIELATDGASEKVASEDLHAAAFIERALASGHRPEDIAAFMKQAGFFSRTMHSVLGRGHVGAGEALKGVGGGLSEKGVRHLGVALRDAAQNMSPAGANRYVERLRASYGDANARKLIEQSGARLNHVQSVRDLLPKTPASSAGKTVMSVTVGGKQHGVTADQLKTVGKPAAVAAGGLAAGKALFGNDDEDKKKKHSNVTVINP